MKDSVQPLFLCLKLCWLKVALVLVENVNIRKIKRKLKTMVTLLHFLSFVLIPHLLFYLQTTTFVNLITFIGKKGYLAPSLFKF